jgi:hypothetical protein
MVGNKALGYLHDQFQASSFPFFFFFDSDRILFCMVMEFFSLLDEPFYLVYLGRR